MGTTLWGISNGSTLEHVEDMTMVQNQGNFEMEEPVPTIN
jgi:hypothetical protein